MFVVRIGGSVLYEGKKINTKLLEFIKKKIIEGTKIKGIVVGGGGYLKEIMGELRKFIKKDEDLHKIGVRMTHFNAEIVRAFLSDVAYRKILTNYAKIPRTKRVLIGGGWKPGYTTDYDAVLLAKKLKVKVVIKLTNVDGVYDKDPNKYKSAKLIDKLTWEDYFKIVRDKIVPGGHYPFDPLAARLAKDLGMKVYVLNGKNLKNLDNFFKGKKFIGTVIQ